MFQDAFQDQSTAFAKQVQDQFRERVRIKDRGVKQAGFLVLHQTAMPGVLIETGFLSNRKDENYLNTDDGQSYIASAIYRAFRDYKNEVERSDNKAAPVTETQTLVTGPPVEIIYRVQIATFDSPKPLNYKKFKGAEYIMEYYHNGLFKYTAGKFNTAREAVEYMNTLKEEKKFKDCFVVAFKDNQRISIEEARSLQKMR
jgi:N-acetylmuramoyl-L-alanine amidase